MQLLFFFRNRFGECHPPRIITHQKAKKFCKKQSGFGHQSRGGQRVSVPGDAVTHGYHSLPSPRDLGRGRGEGCWDTMWMKKMGGVSEVHAQCEAAGGGKGGAKREKGWGCC